MLTENKLSGLQQGGRTAITDSKAQASRIVVA